jgi:hypothetical protein
MMTEIPTPEELPWSRQTSRKDIERARKYVVDWMTSHRPNRKGEFEIPISAYDGTYDPAYNTVVVQLHRKGWFSGIEVGGRGVVGGFLIVKYP